MALPKNSRLKSMTKHLMAKAISQFESTGAKQRVFGDIIYAADSWKYERRIVAKAEYSAKGKNPRFIVTSLSGDGQSLYEKHYCARGEAENRIKAQQLDLFADRTSCTNWIPNQVRLLLSGLAYTLIEAIRRLALTGTSLSSACCGTIRLKLLKIGAVLLKNTRRIQMFLSSAYPYQQMFYTISYRLGANLTGSIEKI